VKAAENGVVAYAGNELKGYGNLVLIRHANNWVSAYAHNEEILVKRGDKVSRGQIIAKAGATGTVSQPLVHFELRKGSRPVDPTKHMSDQAANAE
jgi:murein DD-endopeptidase MepM/ murein hydrolase activator NlpD